MVGRAPYFRQHDLSDVDAEPLVRDFDPKTRDLGVTGPRARIVVGRVNGVAVQRKAGIAAEVMGPPSAGHDAENQLPVVKRYLGTADSRRAVSAQRRHRVMLVGLEQSANTFRERGLILCKFLPAGHRPIFAAALVSMR